MAVTARVCSSLALILLIAPRTIAGQEPRGGVARSGMERAAAELVHPLETRRSVQTSGVTWTCRDTLCVAAVAPAVRSAELCAGLREALGEIARFRRGASELSAAELRSCNRFVLDPRAGNVQIGDGIPGRRLPDEPRLRSDARAELRIAEVIPRVESPVDAGGVVPVEVVVENTGGTAATVALQLVEVSGGASRRSYSETNSIAPHSTARWRLDVTATGSDPTGAPRCGERSVRLLSLVEQDRPAGVPEGYRPGTREGSPWVAFRDAHPEDNERVVSFTFECAVTVEVEAPRSPR